MRELLFGRSYCLGLSRDACTLVAGTRVLAEAPLDGTPERTRAACQEVLGKLPVGRGTLSVVLSGDWVRIWRIAPPQGTERLSDLQAAIAMRFQTLYGDSIESWTVSADYRLQTPFLACAMPRWLQAALQSEAQARGLRLVRMAPQFLLAWNRHCAELAPDAWFGLVHDGSLALGVVRDAQLDAICTTRLPAHADGAWLTQYLQREALRMALPAPRQLLLRDPLGAIQGHASAAALPWRRVGAQQALPAGALLALTGSRA